MSDIFDQIDNDHLRVIKRVKFAAIAVALDVMDEVGDDALIVARRVLASDVLYDPDGFAAKLTIALLVKHSDVNVEEATGDAMKTAVAGVWNAFSVNRSA